MTRTIGIDLGTTNSVAAVIVDGRPTIIPTLQGARSTPSVVGFTMSGERRVGQLARQQSTINLENTIYSIKRFIGRRFKNIEAERARVSYAVTAGRDGRVEVTVPAAGRTYSPEQISAIILEKIKADAQVFLAESTVNAVVTVPAYFDDTQRQATKQAGRIAGLNVLRIINEPTAAAMAYGLDKQENETVLVFDLGGGTFDVSILDVGDGVIEVKAVNGDSHLGGDDYDSRVVAWLANQFATQTGIDLRGDGKAMQRLREAAERAKSELSTVQESIIELPYIALGVDGPHHLEAVLSRTRFDTLNADLTERCRKPILDALNDAGLTPDQIDRVILVGGATRMAAIRGLVRSIIGREPHLGVNPDEAVAIGAAIQAGVIAGDLKDVLLLDVVPISLGIETSGGVFTRLIERNTSIPTARSRTFSTAADNQRSVEIHVLQGEREFSTDNHSLGRFTLDGIPPAPRGVPRVKVEFDIDANGILAVKASEVASGLEQTVTIEGSPALSEAEVAEIVREAELHAEQDRVRRARVDAHVRAERFASNPTVDGTDNGPLDDHMPHGPSSHSAEEIETLNKGAEERMRSQLEELQARAGALNRRLDDLKDRRDRGRLDDGRYSDLAMDLDQERIAVLIRIRNLLSGHDPEIEAIVQDAIGGEPEATTMDRLATVARDKGLGARILTGLEAHRGTVVTWLVEIGFQIVKRASAP